MSGSCCNSYMLQRSCCIPTSTNPKFKPKHIVLTRFHNCCILSTQVIAAAILMAVTSWLFIRPAEPSVNLTGFEIEALTKHDPKNTIIRYNISVHNADLYKSIHFDVLVLRVTYSYLTKGFNVNLDDTGKGLYLGPGSTTTLRTNTFNNNRYPSYGWNYTWTADLLTPYQYRQFVNVRVILGLNYRAFNRVITTRQRTVDAQVYFNDTDGTAFVNPPFGLTLN